MKYISDKQCCQMTLVVNLSFPNSLKIDLIKFYSQSNLGQVSCLLWCTKRGHLRHVRVDIQPALGSTLPVIQGTVQRSGCANAIHATSQPDFFRKVKISSKEKESRVALNSHQMNFIITTPHNNPFNLDMCQRALHGKFTCCADSFIILNCPRCKLAF